MAAVSWWRSLRVSSIARVFDFGTAVLFFGSFAHDQQFQQHASTALRDLAAAGYHAPVADAPLRIYPLEGRAGREQPLHAGGYTRGVISVRPNTDHASREVLLRHELFHDAVARSCGGRVPLWAEEAGALVFSGEKLAPMTPTPKELRALTAQIRVDAPLTPATMDTLRGILGEHGWQAKRCEVDKRIESILGAPSKRGEISYVLVHLLTGRVYASRGNQDSREPIGSLLKIPFAAALPDLSEALLGAALARSDTELLLHEAGRLDHDLLTKLLSNGVLHHEPVTAIDRCRDESCRVPWQRALLGERAADGSFIWEGSLQETALLIRGAFLQRPGIAVELAERIVLPGATIEKSSEKFIGFLATNRIGLKTGTLSSGSGRPLAGHLAAYWPAPKPEFLFIARQSAVRGAELAEGSFPILKELLSGTRGRGSSVRVRLLEGAPDYVLSISAPCPEITQQPHRRQGDRRASLCGKFSVRSRAPGAREERWVSGILHRFSDERWFLETDQESYADAVVEAEGDDLPPEATSALRAVVVMNGRMGAERHQAPPGLCDLTHCMVFRGRRTEHAPGSGISDQDLLNFLAGTGRRWLHFSVGGAEKWKRKVAIKELRKRLSIGALISFVRERERNGEVRFRVVTDQDEILIPCERVRSALGLPSCPSGVQISPPEDIEFAGEGVGHGLGLDVVAAAEAAQRGESAKMILSTAYDAAR